MNVLGIETSCDETGVAVYDSARGLLAHGLHSQVDLHAVYGGVVPEIASRDHLRRMVPLIRQVLKDAGLRRPVSGEDVMSFSGHTQHGCVALAANELTGAPAPGAAGVWRERLWQVWIAALPVGGAVALLGAVWMVVALRRSRRHGEDFLPMVLRLPF